MNGYLVEFGNCEGPSIDLIIENDPQLQNVIKFVKLVLEHGLRICEKFINETYTSTRTFYLENINTDLKTFVGELEVETISKLLRKYREQLEEAKLIEEGQNLGLFRLNNDIMKDRVNDSVSRCLETLQRRVVE